MFNKLILFLLLAPFSCVGQIMITGSVINAADQKPLAGANIFFNNTSTGTNSKTDGSFKFMNVRNGNYELVVSLLGFETYRKTIVAGGTSVNLSAISLTPKTYELQEVKVKRRFDYNRSTYLREFKEQFLGSSELAGQCTILNPELLDFIYDSNTETLSASSVDFLTIENRGLGYRIKFIVADFSYNSKNISSRKLHYQGSVLFEELKGTPSEVRNWQKMRLQVYKGSVMHFLRALSRNRLDEEGFRVLQYANPPRADQFKPGSDTRARPLLLDFPLTENEIVKKTDEVNTYALGCDFDGLHITYNESGHFPKHGQMNNLNSADNRSVSLLNFNAVYTLFDSNGTLLDPGSVTYAGAWGNNRVAELLPVDYEPPGLGVKDDLSGFSGVINKLRDYNSAHIREKTYLHFDKPYYAAGDTIYFKAYVTGGSPHQLSDISGVLHVDLIGNDNKIRQALKLQLTNGIGWGDFTLPDTLPEGIYQIRAYTRWMKNQGENSFFEHAVKIGSLVKKTAGAAADLTVKADGKIDVQFFPEGGTLVNDIQSKIAFKAIDAYGKGMDVRGTIVDNENRQVATFASSHLGMGYFYLTPKPGKRYKAVVYFGGDSKFDIPLKEAEDSGISMEVDNHEIPCAVVKIKANDTFYKLNKGKDFKILIYSGGIATISNCKLDSANLLIDILKRRLKTGIATVTLFSPENTPLCERLIFVQNYDQIELKMNPGQTNLKPREQANIKLIAKNRAGEPSIGHFSVSVIDENKVPIEADFENTIFTELLLTSDLKGAIEQPNYYFTNINSETSANLDLVMLTHGYRTFEWKAVLNGNYPPNIYQPESGLEIKGAIKVAGNNAVEGENISLISDALGDILTQTTDKEGKFAFKNLIFSDTSRIILRVGNGNLTKQTTITYEPDSLRIYGAYLKTNPKEGSVNSRYLENSRMLHEDYLKHNQIKMLDEVKIRSLTKSKSNSSILGGGNANQVLNFDDRFPKAGLMSDVLAGRFHGVEGDAINNKRFMGLILMDGVQFANLNDINPSEVETVELFTGANAGIYGVRAGNGILVVTSKRRRGAFEKQSNSTGILSFKVIGFHKARVFYSPQYANPEVKNDRADFRSTIYWQPELTTDAQGVASFSFYNADRGGRYRVTVEGIDENGNLGRSIFTYDVR